MRAKLAAVTACVLLILCAAVGTVSAQATVVASPEQPVTGERITFTIGTTMEGMDATITTTGLAFESNTGLGNSNHVIVVGALDATAQYTYTVTAQPGETVSLILSDVTESDANGDEREGQRVTWFRAAAAPAQPSSGEPSQEPSAEPSGEPSATAEPSSEPSGNESPAPSAEPSSDTPSASPTAVPSGDQPASASPLPGISGNPSPTINPGADTQNPGAAPSAGNGTGSGVITNGNSTGGGGSSGNTGGSSGVPQTGDIGHFWSLLGIMGVLLVIVIIAGKRVFAED